MQKENLLFSIVTVCYNSEKTIGKTIESVLAQRCTDYEYLIVDGASTDSTLSVIRHFEPLFNGRLHYISEQDNGIYDAFNKGCKLAKGNYVWMVNSDDYIEKDALEQYKRVIENLPIGMKPVISAGVHVCDETGHTLYDLMYDEKDLEWRMRIDSIAFVHPATIIPNSLLQTFQYYDSRYHIAADLDLSRRLWLGNVPFLFPHLIVSNMTRGGISTTVNLLMNIQDRWLYCTKFYQGWLCQSWHLSKWLYRYLKGYIKGWVQQSIFVKRR